MITQQQQITPVVTQTRTSLRLRSGYQFPARPMAAGFSFGFDAAPKAAGAEVRLPFLAFTWPRGCSQRVKCCSRIDLCVLAVTVWIN
jgi:hypothetical protein